jgi:NTE family protein
MISKPEPKRVLILSGGGGRGAFHAGVYKYLMQEHKVGVDAAHRGPWKPEIVAGTSIGAVNGAAIAQGISPSELVEVWENLEETDIQGLPPRMGGLARRIVGRLFGAVMDARLPKVPIGLAASEEPQDFWPPLPLLPRWLAERLVGRWINLLDTGPLKKSLSTRFGIDEQKLASEESAGLLIAATKVLTGERILFSNRPVTDHKRGHARRDVSVGITAERILASCSIPLIYPWTKDRPTDAYYWDGALVANTPLGAALDLAGNDVNIPVEVVVVMMTPWWDSDETPPENAKMPTSFGAAITRVLDWMLLASFRENLKMIDAFNELAEIERRENRSKCQFRFVKSIIVAPKDFMPVERIIDYDRKESKEFIVLGMEAAALAFQNAFRA